MQIITTHDNADLDCVASMVAVQRLYPQAYPVFPGSQERSVRRLLASSFGRQWRFYRPKELDLGQVQKLILVDVHDPQRLGALAQLAADSGVALEIYDHHPGSSAPAHARVQLAEVGATVTLLTEILQQQDMEPTADEATMMLLGLYEDTGSLQFASTTERDFLAAAFLRRCGGDLPIVGRYLQQELSGAQVVLLHSLLDNLYTLNVQGVEVAISHASAEEYVEDVAVLAHKLRDIEQLPALVVAVQLERRIVLVGRCQRGDVPMDGIMAAFGGGGHAYAASASIRNKPLVQVLEELPGVLQAQVEPRWRARDLMSAPVRTVGPQASIKQVQQQLTRFHINALPVVDAAMAVQGIVTRQVVERAAAHGLQEVPASEYMEREWEQVAPETPVGDLEQLSVSSGQRFFPVVEAGRLVGVITRTDLLRHLASGGRTLYPGRALEDRNVGPGGRPMQPQQMQRLLRTRLPRDVQQIISQLSEVSGELEVPAFLVGGFVRDLLLQRHNLDLDVVVEGDGIAFAKAYVSRYGGRCRSHEKFGTAVLVLSEGQKVDVASTRTEYYLAPGALPEVAYASLKLDLYRRDFTVNTLALGLEPSHFGRLLDFFGALQDLREHKLRVLHNLSFVEDPTRIFRALRFEYKLKMALGQQTEYLLRSAVRMGFLERISGARAGSNLQELLNQTAPLPAVERMEELDLLKYLHPSLVLTPRLREVLANLPKALDWFSLLYSGESCQVWLVHLLGLLHELPQEACNAIARRLDLGRDSCRVLAEQRPQAQQALRHLQREGLALANSTRFWLLQPLAVDVLLYMLAAAPSDEVQQIISDYYTRLRGVSNQLDGDDLKALGLAPGPLFREILEGLLAARLGGEVFSRADEVAWVKNRYADSLATAQADGNKVDRSKEATER